MDYKILKIIITAFLSYFLFFSGAHSTTYKIKKLEIELFKSDDLLKSKKVVTDAFGLLKVDVFAEKTENNEIGSIITILTARIDKYGRPIKVFFEDYFYNQSTSLLNSTEDKNFVIIDDKRFNTVSVQELNLEKYLNTQDEFPEYKRAITNLKKKYNIKLPERVLKSDHIYLKGNGDIVWISHMYNYKRKVNENTFDNNISKFHPNSIKQHPNFKNFMDKWINLSLSRHNEFQNKLKIKNKLELKYAGFDIGKNLKTLKKEFYDEDFSTTEKKVVEQKEKEKEEKAKKASEQKAKEEKERKAKLAAEKKAKEQKAKEEKERKAKLAAEKKAKEQKAKEEKERKAKLAAEKKAKEQKAKDEKAKKAAEPKTNDDKDLSVEEIMIKIKDLNEMYKSGLISKEEFELLKNKLLENNSN